MIKEVTEHYGLEAQLCMTTEVCGELACDCAEILSVKAQIGCIDQQNIDYSELTKDMAHVKNAILSVCYLFEIPIAKLETSREPVVEDAVWGKLEQKLLSLSWSCNLLVICCNKFLRASGHGYQIFLSEKTTMCNLVDAMCYVFSDIEGLRTFLGISEDRINRIIADSDKVAYALIQIMQNNTASNKISEETNE